MVVDPIPPLKVLIGPVVPSMRLEGSNENSSKNMEIHFPNLLGCLCDLGLGCLCDLQDLTECHLSTYKMLLNCCTTY